MTRSQDQQLFWSYSCCGLYHGAGYTLIYFSKSDIFVAVRVIRCAGYRPENTVYLDGIIEYTKIGQAQTSTYIASFCHIFYLTSVYLTIFFV